MILLKTIALILALSASVAYAKNVELKEQMVMSKYMADGLNALPDNQAAFSKFIPNLSAKDQKIANKIVRDWKSISKGMKITTRLNQLVLMKDYQAVMTIETLQMEPTILLVDGFRKITIDPKDISGSISKSMKSGDKTAGAIDFMRSLFVREAFAAPDEYSIAKLAGLNANESILFMHGAAVATAYPSRSYPWHYLYGQYKPYEAAFESIFGGFPEMKFNCGTDYVKGKMYSVDGKIHDFQQTAGGLYLGKNIRLNLVKGSKERPGVEGYGDILIEDCSANCRPIDITEYVSKPNIKDQTADLKLKIESATKEIADIEGRFQKQNGLPEPLKYNLAEEKLAKTPPANISGQILVEYKSKIEPIYRRQDKFKKELEKITKDTAYGSDQYYADAKKKLFDMISLGRAMLAGCGDNEFRVLATGGELKIKPDSDAKAAQ